VAKARKMIIPPRNGREEGLLQESLLGELVPFRFFLRGERLDEEERRGEGRCQEMVDVLLACEMLGKGGGLSVMGRLDMTWLGTETGFRY